MPPGQLCRTATLLACLWFAACTFGPAKDISPGATDSTGGGTSGAGQAKPPASHERAGTGGSAGVGSGAPPRDVAVGSAAGEGSSANAESVSPSPESASPDPGSGSPGLAPDPSSGPDPIHEQCDLNGGCVAKCSDQTVTCAVKSLGVFCELDGFAGASAPVACGQRVVIGTACCGGCGCVPVEVFFDGTSCWQGMPQCTLPNVADQFFEPHEVGAPDGEASVLPNNGVPGQFYRGTGGQSAQGGTAGTGNGAGGVSEAGASEAPAAKAGGAGVSASGGPGS